MARRRKAEPVTLTTAQRERLERLWFVYGNHGPKTTPGNHQFIQCLLEHGIDIRPLQTKRTARRDVPTAECIAAVERILAWEGSEGEGAHFGQLRLVPPPAGGRAALTPDPELKKLIEGMRRRRGGSESGGLDAGGKDAA